MIYKMTLKDSVDTMTFNLLETPIVDKDIEGAVDNVTLDGNQYTDYLYLKKQYIQKWAIMCPDEYDELRGFYTRQFEDGEVPSYRVYYGANVTRDYTFNGDYFQFNAEGIETGMTLTQLLGNAEQTTYSGKNLLPPPADYNKTVGGLSIKCVGGVFTISGTSTSTAHTEDVLTTPYTIQSGDYYHLGNDFISSQMQFNLYFTDGTLMQAGIDASNNRIYSLSSYVGKTISQIRIYFNSGYTFNGTASPMILHNISTQTDFEPYTGGVPMPNPQFPSSVETVSGAQTVKITGKNLLDTSNAGNQSAGGMTATWNNGTVEVKGTNTATSFPLSNNIALPTQIKAGTEISASFVGASVGNTVFRFFNQATSQYEGLTVTNPNTSGTYTLTRDADAVQLYKGAVPTNTYKEFSISNWQIEYGSQPSEYKPYDGTQSYEVNLGKNLLDINSLATANITVSNGVATGQAQHFYAAYGQSTDGVPFIKKSGQLAISFKAYTDGNESTANTNGLVVQVVYTDGTSALVIYCKNNETTAVQHIAMTASGKDVANIKLTYANCSSNIWHISEFQIEAGFPTTYAPYKTPIELCKIGTYQDRIYKDDGKWYIEKQIGKVVLDGTENWTLGTMFYCTDALSGKTAVTPATGGAIMSDYFTYSGGATNDPSIDIVNGNVLRIRDTSKADASAFTTWLGAHPTTVYYALAAPTTTEITDETLLYQLNFLASLYKGENNISLVGTGAQGEMEVFIRDVMSVETDVVPEVPVRLTLTDDGVINACGCRRNVQLTMRETTE